MIIIYGSKYGTAKRYANALSEKLNVKCIPFDETPNLDGCKTIIYIGSLYAGGVLGLKKTVAKNDFKDKQLIIATVGLADPMDSTNANNIKQGIKRQVPKELFEKAKIFHLRGAIDYSKLNFKHKAMMALLYKKAKSLPDEQKTAEVRAMIETYNKQVDFVNLALLEPIVELCTK